MAIAASPTGATENGYLVTITTSAAHNLAAGQTVTIAGVGVAGYNGTFAVIATPSSTQFTYVAGISGLVASGGGTVASSTVTIQTMAVHGFVVGQLVLIAGVGVAGYNGTFTISSVPDGVHFTYTGSTGGLANSGGGTASAAGNIAQGVHQVSVLFQTRQGYLTKPSPATSWTASGNKRAVVTNIPTGPSNIVARILCFTSAAGDSFFYVGAGSTLFSGNMIVSDNTTTSVVVDFADATLLAATNVDNLFRLVELGDCAGVIDYSQRVFWWGERAKMDNWANLGFDGGFTGPALPHYPLGWTPDATYAAGGIDEENFVVWGAAYSIVGNGATATRGLITQTAVADALGAPLIQANTAYTVRARCARNATLAQGTLHIHLYSAIGSINTTGLQLSASQVTTSYVEYSAQLTSGLSTIPSDLVLRVYADGTPTLNGQFYVDCIEIAPSAQPCNSSLVRCSRVEDPESFDGIDGLLSIAENNGQAIRAAFKLRERLYFVKEHSLHVTQDDGTNEPALWSISEVSRGVGTPSTHGVGIGEDWVVIAHRTGLYLFSGGEPVKISQEIQPTWNQINWQYGQTLWVTVDNKERRIYVGAPFGSATTPNQILMLDYHDLNSADDISSRPPVNITYTGRKTATDNSRKWARWMVAANSCALLERPNGTAVAAMGGGVPGVGGGGSTGKVYQLSDTQYSDDGTAIASYYTTHFFPERAVETALSLGAHRKLFSYLTMFVEGAGNLGLSSDGRFDERRAGAADIAAEFAGPRGSGAADQCDRRASGVSGEHESSGCVVQAAAIHAVDPGRTVVAGAWDELSFQDCDADHFSIGADQDQRSVLVRNAGEDCRCGERGEHPRGSRSRDTITGAVTDRIAEGASGQRLVRPGDHRQFGVSARAVLFCGVGRDAGVQLAACLFPGIVAEFVRAAGQSGAVLARVFAVHRVAGIHARNLRFASDRSDWRRRVRPHAATDVGQRAFGQRSVPLRQRLRHTDGRAGAEAHNVVER